MRTHEEFCSEIFERKNTIIRKRKERKRIVFACVPFALCAVIALGARTVMPDPVVDGEGEQTTHMDLSEGNNGILESPGIEGELSADVPEWSDGEVEWDNNESLVQDESLLDNNEWMDGVNGEKIEEVESGFISDEETNENTSVHSTDETTDEDTDTQETVTVHYDSSES